MLEKKKYSDLDLSFTPHPDTGDIIPLRDERAVIRAVRQLISTNFYEKLYSPRFGGNVIAELFELYTPQTRHILESRIREAINHYERRVEVVNIEIVGSFENTLTDNNAIAVTLQFRLVGSPNIKQFTFIFKRAR